MYKLKYVSILLITLFLSACGGGSSSNGTNDTTPPSNNESNNPKNPSKLSGILTFDEYDNLMKYRTGVVSFNLTKMNDLGYKVASGSAPYRHKSGKVVFREGCGAQSLQLSILNTKGLTTPITPCVHSRNFTYLISKISPDESKILTIVSYTVDDPNALLGYRTAYSTLIYKVNGEKRIYREEENAFSADWLPDGRLLLSRDGLYLTDKNLENPSRIDNNQLQSSAENIDVSPSGKQVVFEYNKQIWIMDIDGKNLKQLIRSDKNLRYPTWSPDQKYIAYFAQDSNDFFDAKIYFFQLDTEKKYHLETKQIFSVGKTGYPDVTGPLSWIHE